MLAIVDHAPGQPGMMLAPISPARSRVGPTVPRPAEGRIGPGEPLVNGLKRLLRAEIDGARSELANLTPNGAARTIHLVRRRLKRARTIARLLRPTLGAPARALGTILRDAGRALAGPRDALVLAETARETARRLQGQEGIALLDRIAEEEAHRAAVDARHAVNVATARKLLAEAKRRLPALGTGTGGPVPVIDRVAGAYCRARKGWRHAARSADIEALHDWRRRVQARLHVVRLFADQWPEPGRRRERRLDRLSEILGRDHDLAMLAARLPETGAATATIRSAIERRHVRLVAKAFALAGSLFEEKPRVIRRAWRVALAERRPLI
jgi:CHAD domain-containing protein